MPKNKYVDFVSDEHFLKCVKHVCDSYLDISRFKNSDEVKEFVSRNSLDSFKMIFDVMNMKGAFESWMSSEIIRQGDKTVTNRIGDCHQMLLGGVDGWENLKTGNELGIDLRKKDNSIFIELKNKWNTVKGEDQKNVFDKLKKVADKYKKAIVYYAYITPKNPSSGEKIWKPSQRTPDERIKEAWSFKVYEIVTEDKNALKNVWKVLPQGISDILKKKINLNKEDEKKFLDIFDSSFGSG